jgi:hypothetical protein
MSWDDEPISYRDEYIDPFSDLEEDLNPDADYDDSHAGWDEEDHDGYDDEG